MATEPVLVVDLDGTLIRSDLLLESFWSALGRHWTTPLHAAVRLSQGRAALKRYLAEQGPVDPAALPYNPAVLDHIRDWRAGGGRVALVSASDAALVRQVADHLGLFDEVQGSDGTTNLKGAAKADVLTERFGPRGFHYVADAAADLPVWAVAARAITVDARPALRARVEAVAPDVLHLGTAPERLRPALRALRPHQWLKNLLVFLPMVAAHDFAAQTWAASALAFVAFCLSASAVYIVNDLLDLGPDRAHPRKRARPIAAGDLPIRTAMLICPALALAGLGIGTLLGGRFVVVLLVYQIATSVYSLALKRRMVIDICALAGLYTLRIVAGGVATGIPLSVWLLAYAAFFFFSVAAMKRLAELVDRRASGDDSAPGRGYEVGDLPLVAGMATTSGYVAVLVLALYVNSPEVQMLYSSPRALWGVCMVMLYWISRAVLLAHRGKMHDDPVVFALRDPASLLCMALILACAAAGAWA